MGYEVWGRVMGYGVWGIGCGSGFRGHSGGTSSDAAPRKLVALTATQYVLPLVVSSAVPGASQRVAEVKPASMICEDRKVDIKLLGNGNSNSRGARPVYSNTHGARPVYPFLSRPGREPEGC